ncbi:hypothetical protein LEP1GSC193_1986 [Leptospira alstonii serovar Pingchang str. 80-412]|uniref:Uncharacterized protein n=2 Tax=Leptospira alstonii TaxID=28452 RepID=M6CPK7_9LEPT|nr:hypothetical protein LEP1GSC194_1709 [Leptospira alstonii serovar Sichuan str. 79601]EQA81389.1 hypothetical protein LEP1GSC193_1986 [Leptospira alstonii serovar Pingchang str. 80-412]
MNFRSITSDSIPLFLISEIVLESSDDSSSLNIQIRLKGRISNPSNHF